MKSKIIKIFLIFCASVLAILIFYLLNKDEKLFSLNKERIFKKEIKLEKSIPLDKKLSLMKYRNNRLYFVSWTDGNQGKLFSLNLKNNQFDEEIDLNSSLESIIINNYYIENGRICFINKANRAISTYDLTSKAVKSLIYRKDFSRISKRSNNLIVSGWDKDYKIYFEKFNMSTKESSEIKIDDDYLHDYENTGITLDGVYYENDNYTVMLPYSVNRAYVFDQESNFSNKIDLIYNKTAFNFRYSKDKKDLMVDPNNLNPNLSGCLDQSNHFYALTDQSTKWDNRDKCYIDIYDVQKNEYISSIKIGDYNNSKPRSILINQNKLYVLFEENLNIYIIK